MDIPDPLLATFPYLFIAFGRSSRLHSVSSHSCWMYVLAGRPAFARPYVGVHRSKSRMSSSLFLQQWPACLVRLTWIVFVMGGNSVILTKQPSCPVCWGCRIHRLLLCRGVRFLPQRVSLYMTLNNLINEVPVMLWASKNAEYPFIVIVPRSTMTQSGSTW